ncbi:M20 family metallo-hydrolase [Nocardia brasiliensis]|uniref:M20 family metallo-hydrolase n=1 Tax=Nocardia brasiliensis TaxID=37326 RepID=UPI00245806B8|nr:M20 family metallo-hydrolase [Nocardia brasiliensis]
MTVDKLIISTERFAADVAALAGITDDSLPGFTRIALSELYRDGRAWLASRMRDAGLVTDVDAAGNLVGTLAGRHSGPAVVTGSHIDTVREGGRYDGIVGVLGALEAVRALREAGIRLEHPLKVIAFFGEEANEFGLAHFGSRAIGGTLRPEHLALTNFKGERLADALSARAGIDPEVCLRARWNPDEMVAYVELHIEQGPLLEQHGRSVGLVTGIAGAQRFVASIHGRPDHSGNTPMARRRDALCAAAELALSVEEYAWDHPGGVATVGAITVTPGQSNVVPGTAELIGDMRSLDSAWLTERQRDIDSAAGDLGRRRGVDVSIAWPSVTDPTLFTEPVQRVIGSVLRAGGHDPLPITSGAGHDAQEMAMLGPAGMIFVPSHDGRSHCPEEHTDLADLVIGVQALAETLVAFDRGE